MQVVDEVSGNTSETDHSDRSSSASHGHNTSAYFLNNFTSAEKVETRKCSLEDNDLDDGVQEDQDQGRPQRRKRSMEERHPDFVMDRQVKTSKILNSSLVCSQGRKSRNEI